MEVLFFGENILINTVRARCHRCIGGLIEDNHPLFRWWAVNSLELFYPPTKTKEWAIYKGRPIGQLNSDSKGPKIALTLISFFFAVFDCKYNFFASFRRNLCYVCLVERFDSFMSQNQQVSCTFCSGTGATLLDVRYATVKPPSFLQFSAIFFIE